MNTDENTFAYRLDGKRAKRAALPKLDQATTDQGVVWVHLDTNDAEACAWLKTKAGVDELTANALLAENTSPRCVVMGQTILLFLRGVNLNPGSEPDEMVSVRMLLGPDKIISASRQTLDSIREVRNRVAAGAGPTSSGDLIVTLANGLLDRIAPYVHDMADSLDQTEDLILKSPTEDIETNLGALRRRIIRLRRYLAPQRLAMAQVLTEDLKWLDGPARSRFREATDRTRRFLDDLDAYRDRGHLVLEEISAHLTRQVNRNTYLLTVLAGILLPLSFVTGLLGINVGGIPGAQYRWAFAIVCGGLAAMALILNIVARRRRLL